MNEASDFPKHPAGRVVPRFVGGAAVVVGCGALAALVFGFPEETRLFPRVVLIKANAAIAFILSGGALFLLQVPGQRTRQTARICALVVGGIALLTMAEYSIGRNFGIDEFVMRDRGAGLGNPHPGRMALNSAAGFALFAGALWLMSATTWSARRIFPLMGLGAMVEATGRAAMLGYLSVIRAGYSSWGSTVMPHQL